MFCSANSTESCSTVVNKTSQYSVKCWEINKWRVCWNLRLRARSRQCSPWLLCLISSFYKPVSIPWRNDVADIFFDACVIKSVRVVDYSTASGRHTIAQMSKTQPLISISVCQSHHCNTEPLLGRVETGSRLERTTNHYFPAKRSQSHTQTDSSLRRRILQLPSASITIACLCGMWWFENHECRRPRLNTTCWVLQRTLNNSFVHEHSPSRVCLVVFTCVCRCVDAIYAPECNEDNI